MYGRSKEQVGMWICGRIDGCMDTGWGGYVGLGWVSDECRVSGCLMDVGLAIWMCGWREVSQWLDERTDE
jgi:hypothetical protein